MLETDQRPPRSASPYVGAFFLVMAGINIGISIADPLTYRHFADHGLFPFVRAGWQDIVMVHPVVWIGLLAAGEIAIGSAFLASGAWRRAAYVAAISFHVALMLFGWGVWLWAVPSICLLVLGRRRDLRGASPVQHTGRTSGPSSVNS